MPHDENDGNAVDAAMNGVSLFPCQPVPYV